MSLLPVSEALRRLLEHAATLPGEQVAIAEAAGRVLATPLLARRTQPPFAASAMDGYAVRAVDLATIPVALKVVGKVAAGHHFSGRLGAGETVRIFTGAPLPEGADAVLIQENTEAIGDDTVRALAAVKPGRHVRSAGLDFSEGERLLDPGRLLDPAALSLAAAGNHASLDVVRRPRVAILATGDELLPPGSEPGPDKIIASNAYGVGAIAAAAGGVSHDLGIVADDRRSITAAINRAIDTGADILVTLGGASVGEHDLVGAALTELGMDLTFWKIAMRPGKPLMVGRLGNVHVLGLPGNPVSSLVCSHVFLVPLVARLAGRRHAQDIREAKLAAALAGNDEREDYLRAAVRQGPDGLEALPFDRQDSSMLKVLAASDGLVIRPPHAPPAAMGETCRVLMLREPQR